MTASFFVLALFLSFLLSFCELFGQPQLTFFYGVGATVGASVGTSTVASAVG